MDSVMIVMLTPVFVLQYFARTSAINPLSAVWVIPTVSFISFSFSSAIFCCIR